MVLVPIHQDTSSVPPMTTPVIDLTKSQFDYPLPTSTTTSTITITTILPTPQPQQSTADPILVKHIGELELHMADLIQNNLALEERLDKQGSWLYKLENLNIPHKVSQAVDEIVINAIDWAMQAPLRARFRDMPTVDMKKILQQRMFKDNSYQAHDVHNDLYEALQKSLELDYTNQHLVDQEEARKKRQKRRDVPRTPPRSLPSPPPPVGASGALGTSGASGSSQLPPPPPPPSTGTSGAAQFESNDFTAAQELSPTDSLMQDDSIPDEQWKPLPEEERPATPEPAWTISSSNKSDVANNWASALAITYEPPAENSLLAKTGDMMTFLKWYCRQVNKTTLTQADFEGQAYEVVKAFYPYVIHLQFQMEECHKMLTDQVNWANPEGDQGSCPALSISKMKAASYPDFGLELLVPEQMWIDDVCNYDMSEHICGFSVSSELKPTQDTDMTT
ncbi:hypothetical protein Tco_0180920 [Tanacetum coccineum]